LIADSKNHRLEIFKIVGDTRPALAQKQAQTPSIEFDSYIPASLSAKDLFYSSSLGLFALSDREGIIYHYKDVPQRYGDLDKETHIFRNPDAIAVLADGTMLVADTDHHRVQILAPDGTTKFQFGKMGSRTGQFNSPQGIVVNSKGNIFVADTQNDRVQIFNETGIFLNSFGTTSKSDKIHGPQKGYFLRPKALAVDSHDRIYVADFDNNRIQVFDENGEVLKSFGSKGNVPAQFDKPSDVAIDENDFLYVADQGNNRVQIFDAEGNYLTSFGSIGNGPSSFPELTGVAAHAGKIYVANEGQDQIKVFQLNKSSLAPQLDIVSKTEEKIFEAAIPEVKASEPAAKPAPEPAPKPLEAVKTDKTPANVEKTNPEESVVVAQKTQAQPESKETVKTSTPTKEAGNDPSRFYATKSFFLPPNFDRNNADQVQQVKLLTQFEAMRDLAGQLGIPNPEALAPYVKIEKEGYVNDGQFQMTVSVAKDIKITDQKGTKK
jgi:DNA-binding beta-propeller fold protein YncE